MRRFKALILCITILFGYLGMSICNNSLSEKKPEGTVSQAVEITSTTAPSATSTPSITPMQFVPEKTLFDAKPIVEKTPSVEAIIKKYGEIDIPAIEVAQLHDREDAMPVNKRNPAQLNNNTVNVKEVIESTYSSNKVPSSSDYEIKTRIGIDVSQWQEDIDWKKVADSGVEFAMIRIGYRGSVYGKIVLDHYFYDNIEGALANGIDVGIYFYSQAINEQEAIQEAAWLCEIIKNYNITYPVAYDLEEVEINRIANVSYEQLNRNAVAFLDYVAAKGYTPCMYGCKSYLESVWDMKLYKNCYVWVAHVGVTHTTYAGHYDMWQYSWTGKIPGIRENVDMNIEYIRVPKKPAEEPKEEAPEEEVTLEPSEEATVTTDTVVSVNDETKLYSEPDEEAEVIVTLPAGVELVRVETGYDGYSAVEYEGNVVYVLTESIMEVEPVELAEETTVQE